MAKSRGSRLFRSRDWLLWTIVALLVIWGVSQALRLESNVHTILHESNVNEQSIQEAQQDEPSPPVITQAVYLSAQQADPSEAQGPDHSNHSGALEVIDPGLIAATDGKITLAHQFIDQGDIPAARKTLNNALDQIADFDIPEADDIRRELTQMNRSTLLSSGLLPNDPLAGLITVGQGDTIDYLANLYRISPAELLWLNPQINPNKMPAGTSLKIISGPFDARLILHAARLEIYDQATFILSYNVEFTSPILPSPGEYNIVLSRLGDSELSGKRAITGGELVIEPVSGDLRMRLTIAGPPKNSTDVAMNTEDASELVRLLNINFSHVEVAP
ncbi:MAG TPA: LysM domain-containing protein [Phycisphaerae bacterium]|nr:LysM domain-containing protein [Phycisphaerae bacterium]